MDSSDDPLATKNATVLKGMIDQREMDRRRAVKASNYVYEGFPTDTANNFSVQPHEVAARFMDTDDVYADYQSDGYEADSSLRVLTCLNGVERRIDTQLSPFGERLALLSRMQFGGISVIKCLQMPVGHSDRSQFEVVQQYAGMHKIRNTGSHNIHHGDILLMDTYKLNGSGIEGFRPGFHDQKLVIPITPWRCSEDELPSMQLAYLTRSGDLADRSNSNPGWVYKTNLVDLSRAMDGQQAKNNKRNKNPANAKIDEAGDALMEAMVLAWLNKVGRAEVQKITADNNAWANRNKSVAESMAANKGIGASVYLGLPWMLDSPLKPNTARQESFVAISAGIPEESKARFRKASQSLVRINSEAMRYTLERVVGVARSNARMGEMVPVHLTAL